MADYEVGSYIGYETRYLKPGIIKSDLLLLVDASDPASYPRSGNTFYDLSGNNRHGTIQSGVTFTNRNSFMFYGTTSGYISFPLVTTAITNVTLMAYVYMPPSEGGAIFYNGSGGGYGVGIGASTFDDAGNNAIGLFQGIRWIDTNVDWGTGWMMIGMTLDSASTARFFKNGVLIATSSGTAPATPNTNTLLGLDTAGGGRSFSGEIAWAAMYGTNLNATNQQRNTAAIRERFHG